MKQWKILIADDDPDILRLMEKKVSSQEDYDTVTAKDGEEAWEKIKKESPDVIVLDLTMPKMDGLDVLKNLRENPPTDKWQPVIIVSGRGDLDDRKKGFSLEADHYIIKPCSMDDILKGINLMINLIPQRKSADELKGEER